MNAIDPRNAQKVCLAAALTCLAPMLAAYPDPPAAEHAQGEFEDSFESARAAASTKLVQELEALAAWCQKNRLFGCRDGSLEVILHFRPDDAACRRKLKYRRKAGVWERSRGYRTPRDYNSELRAEFEKKSAELARDYLAQLSEFAEGNGAIADQLWSDVIAIDHGNRAARTARGEALCPDDPSKKRWVLQETVRSKARRSVLAAEAKRLLAELPKPVAFEPDPTDHALGVRWTQALAMADVRVIGTGSRKELEACARNAQAAILLFGRACDTGVGIPRFTIYVVDSESESRNLSMQRPGLRTPAGGQKTTCTWLGLYDLVVWPTTQEQRLDHLVRQTLGLMLVNHYPGSHSQSWTIEGATHVLATLLRGERAFQPMFTVNTDAAVMRSPSAIVDRWRSLYGHTGIEKLLELPANQLDRDARERAAVITRYLIEARPEDWDRVLGALGGDASMRSILEETLEMKLSRLEQRVLRWLEESGEPTSPS